MSVEIVRLIIMPYETHFNQFQPISADERKN